MRALLYYQVSFYVFAWVSFLQVSYLCHWLSVSSQAQTRLHVVPSLGPSYQEQHSIQTEISKTFGDTQTTVSELNRNDYNYFAFLKSKDPTVFRLS